MHWGIEQFITAIEKQYMRCCPYGAERLKKLSYKTAWTAICVAAAAGVGVFFWNLYIEHRVSSYCFMSIALAVYVACVEVPEWYIRRVEERLYHSMLRYFAAVKHLYLSYKNIPNAIHDAAEETGEEIRLHAAVFYDILIGSARRERVRSYVESETNCRYLKMFLVQAYEASEKGDMKTLYSESLFSENIEYLRMEVMQEIYRRKRRAHELSGYTFVTLAPVFTMSVLRRWGISFTAELEGFYAGAGNSIVLLCFIATLAVYAAINRAKEVGFQKKEVRFLTEHFAEKRQIYQFLKRIERMAGARLNWLKRLLMQSGMHVSLEGILARIAGNTLLILIVMLLFFSNLHIRERGRILYEAAWAEQIVPTASEQMRKALGEHMLALVKQHKNGNIPTEDEIITELRELIYLPNKAVEKAIAEEILQKLIKLKHIHIKWYEILLCIFCAFLGAVIPIAELVYRKGLIYAGAVEEIKQFQSVIWLERRLEGLTIVRLLEDMEIFAVVFQPVIRECVNSYSSGPREALQKMKAMGGIVHESFSDLADGFLAVEEVGMKEAFAEVENNRSMLEKMSQLEADIQMERKKDSTDLLSRIPMFLTVGVYFILPFLWTSFAGVGEVFLMLEELQR